MPRDCTRLLHPCSGALSPGGRHPGPRGFRPDLQAGLLTPGSSYTLRLPPKTAGESGIWQGSSPVTAAGPCRLRTGFPIKPGAPVLPFIVRIPLKLSRKKRGGERRKSASYPRSNGKTQTNYRKTGHLSQGIELKNYFAIFFVDKKIFLVK